MQLMDLPLEIIRAILEQTVLMMGEVKSVQLQLVNEFFAEEVTRAVCTTRCFKSSLYHYDPWIPRYIQSRSLAVDAVEHHFLYTIKQTTEALIASLTGDEQHIQRLRISLRLSKLAIKHRYDLLNRLTIDHYKDLTLYYEKSSQLETGQKSDAPEHLLSVAAYHGDITSVQHLVAQGVDVNSGSNAFGKPLWASKSVLE